MTEGSEDRTIRIAVHETLQRPCSRCGHEFKFHRPSGCDSDTGIVFTPGWCNYCWDIESSNDWEHAFVPRDSLNGEREGR